ncbi:sensor domain-containing diguanylate cyclase [Luteimonas terrae]|uniref:Diguanylate cyclase (GGDEF)-like protein n=1 Tax=Luteimonas terrae TaxID=1530191 RepID=A0ABU1XRW4_9GAMM|nr:sensor domain-containing diguanylate cyclase [Luteimonas terrae]MDR7191502.1 diguanylate cyclase (GGDEF)-like protein [Luteimonas terrae]
MIRPPMPADEDVRQATLDAYRILDTQREEAYDDLVAIAAAICNVPIAVISLVDRDRQWFKAARGIDGSGTSREMAFCAYAILDPSETMVVNDAREDPRFSGNPLVVGGPRVRFYAGAPMRASNGQPMGTVCVLDDRPRQLETPQRIALEALSRQASRLMELHSVSRALRLQLEERGWYEQQLLHYQRELEHQNADLEEQSSTDPLTGLANRRAFSRTLEAAITRAHAAGEPLSVAIVDIDHFKSINDLHGHAEGDRVLQALGAMLLTGEAARGRVARFGGEEFVRLLPDRGLTDAARESEYLREAVAAMPTGLPVTISIGVATLQPSEDASSLLARADQALYKAKHEGRDRVCALP